MDRTRVEESSRRWRAERGLAPVPVVAVAEGAPGSALAQRLRWYKDADEARVRSRLTQRLGWSLCRFVADNPALLVGVDVITCPGSARRSAEEAIVDAVPRLAARHRRLLATNHPVDRRHDPDAFRVDTAVAGLRVVVFDDAYVTGATSHSAADALTGAGADVAAILVAGRITDRQSGIDDHCRREIA